MQNRGMGLGAQGLGCGERVPAPAGTGQGSCCRRGWGGLPKRSQRGVCEEMGGKAGQGGCRWLQGMECTMNVYTRPLLKSAWLGDWERKQRSCGGLVWSGLVGGGESPGAAVCTSWDSK